MADSGVYGLLDQKISDVTIEKNEDAQENYLQQHNRKERIDTYQEKKNSFSISGVKIFGIYHWIKARYHCRKEAPLQNYIHQEERKRLWKDYLRKNFIAKWLDIHRKR